MKGLRKLGAVILAVSLAACLPAVPAQAVNGLQSSQKQDIMMPATKTKFPGLKDQSLELRKGESKKIRLENCSGLKVTYASDDKSIATVSKKGNVKGKEEGRTYIYVTAKTKKGELRGRWTCRIDVKPALASKKTVEETIDSGKQMQIQVSATKKDAKMEVTIITESEDENLNLSIGIPENANNYAQKVPVVDRITPDKKEVTLETSKKIIIWNNGDNPVDVTVKIKTSDGKKTISNVKSTVL